MFIYLDTLIIKKEIMKKPIYRISTDYSEWKDNTVIAVFHYEWNKIIVDDVIEVKENKEFSERFVKAFQPAFEKALIKLS